MIATPTASLLGRRATLPALALWLAPALAFAPAHAQEAEFGAAEALIRDAGHRLAAVAANPVPAAERQRLLAVLLDEVVDIAGVARFCLGRFWRDLTPAQQGRYVALFRDVLTRNVGGRLGDYQPGGAAEAIGVTTARPVRRGELIEVPTTVERPHNAPAHVTWVVGVQAGRARIVDVVAEGISLRLTQRSDYATFLARHDNDVEALLRALRSQASG